jgi:hypothetical protein
MTVQEEEKEPETADVPEETPDQEETHAFAKNGENGENQATRDESAGEGVGEKKKVKTVSADAPWGERMWEVFTTFWPLGFVAFGGPQAHVAILRDHLVEQRDWLDEEQVSLNVSGIMFLEETLDSRA